MFISSVIRSRGAGARTTPQYAAFLAQWNQSFHGWNAADFGWGADRIQNILWRLDNGELTDVNPKVIVIMAGTNNVSARSTIGNEPEIAADIADGISAIVQRRPQAGAKGGHRADGHHAAQ